MSGGARRPPQRPPVVVLAGIRWGFLWQRHQALAALFARAGYPTTFVETTGLSDPRPTSDTLRGLSARLLRAAGGTGGAGRDLPPGLAVYPPLVAPPTARAFRWANRRLFLPRVARDLRRISGPSPVVVAYPPTRTTLDLISLLKPRLLVFDRADDYAAFPGAPADIAATEEELLLAADLVSCTSAPLLESARALRPDAFPSGPGVDYGRFAVLRTEPPATRIKTVCFFGDVDGGRLDLGVLRAVAGAGVAVRLVGRIGRADRGFLRVPGVDHRGEVPHARLPEALSGVDAFVLPYKINRLTRSIAPAKTFECLATGKPVVAAPLPDLAKLQPHVHLAREPGEYVGLLRRLPEWETGEGRRARISLASENSWEARFSDLEARMLGALG